MGRPDPPSTTPPDEGAPSAPADAADAAPRLPPAVQSLRMGWRLRLLVLAALVGCLGLFALIRLLAATPAIDAHWSADPRGRIVLTASDTARLQAHVGRELTAITASDGHVIDADASLLQRAPRWVVRDADRARLVALHRELDQALAQGPVHLTFRGNQETTLVPRARGLAGLGLVFWPLAALALVLGLTGVVVMLARPHAKNLLYLLLTSCQAANLLFIAAESARGLPLPAFVVAPELALRSALDIVSAAAILHAFALHPTALPRHRAIAAGGWGLAGAALLALQMPGLAHAWWWAQGTIIALGLGAIAVLTASYRIHPNPFTMLMRRFGFVTVGSLGLLTVALAAAADEPGLQGRVAEVGSGIWYVFLASLLLLVPFLSRSSQLLREFALLAGISTVATSLDLLFVALFAFGPLASTTLAVFIALGVYAGARQWILDQITARNVLTLERSFEALYRVAREVEARPERREALLMGLLRDLFDPLEVERIPRRLPQSRAIADGSSLQVPVACGALPDGEPAAGVHETWVLRYAGRGKRLFTSEDARLADRICELLRRAVAYDKAVERGRSEERLRIAQDLHDDIGARLLTLMYKAPDPEVEDYVRHTLQDLKTLTRGLATPEHRLSHAIAEWKADVAQRLSAARIELDWSFEHDRDPALTVVQWSGLTRILRELVTNVIAHAYARRVSVRARLAGGHLTLVVADDGSGRAPQTWSHGLGLGGVRKRVKLLGGSVRWRENAPQGIACEVVLDGLDNDGHAP